MVVLAAQVQAVAQIIQFHQGTRLRQPPRLQHVAHHVAVDASCVVIADGRDGLHQGEHLLRLEGFQGAPVEGLLQARHGLELTPQAGAAVLAAVGALGARPAARQPEAGDQQQRRAQQMVARDPEEPLQGIGEPEEQIDGDPTPQQPHVLTGALLRFGATAAPVALAQQDLRPAMQPGGGESRGAEQHGKSDQARNVEPCRDRQQRRVGRSAAVHPQQEEKRKDQPGVGAPGPVQAAFALQVAPEGTFGIDVDAGALAGHAGALFASVRRQRAAHRLGDARAGVEVGALPQRAAQACQHLLHRPHRADVLAPGLASEGPAHGQGGRHGAQEQHRQRDRAVVHRQQPQAEPRDQQRPLQLHVVLPQPGVGADLHHIQAAIGAAGPPLAIQGPGQLRHEGQGTDATPELMAHSSDDQQAAGHNAAPEQPIAVQASHRHHQRQDQTDPADQQQPTHPLHRAFRPLPKLLHADRKARASLNPG